ncbi:MAG: hypothetical protein AAGF22_10080 [Pseudomonadota bacterium]
MNNQTAQTPPDHDSFLRSWGFWAVLSGALGLLFVFIQIIAPTLQPSPSVGVQIGEIAGEIKRSAWRSFLGQPEEAVAPQPVSILNYLALAAPIFGVLAIVLSVISRVVQENWRLSAYGTCLGAAAVLFYFFWWLALLFAAVIIMSAIIENIGDIFSF